MNTHNRISTEDAFNLLADLWEIDRELRELPTERARYVVRHVRDALRCHVYAAIDQAKRKRNRKRRRARS
jgi:DNA-directed RNA polymerase beta' subunit